jgi:hypothetical protein
MATAALVSLAHNTQKQGSTGHGSRSIGGGSGGGGGGGGGGFSFDNSDEKLDKYTHIHTSSVLPPLRVARLKVWQGRCHAAAGRAEAYVLQSRVH